MTEPAGHLSCSRPGRLEDGIVPERRLPHAAAARSSHAGVEALGQPPITPAALARAVASVGPALIEAARYEVRPEGYLRAILSRGQGIELVAIRWPAGVVSALHTHGPAHAWLEIRSGRVREDRFVPERSGFRHTVSTLSAGDASGLGRGAYHRVVGLTDAFAIHAYTPVLENPSEAPDAEALRRLAAAWAGPGPLPAWLQASGAVIAAS
jgi:hypothetical protein